MTEVLPTYDPLSCESLDSFTFSQASAAGLTHSGWLAGPATDPLSRAVVLASHSVSPERVRESLTNAISGPPSGGSSRTCALQQSLASRLRQRMAAYGSPEYELTWKSWDMPSGPPICALRASARRISGKGCSGWPSSRTVTGGPESGERKKELGRTESGGGDLQSVALIAGWGSPRRSDHKCGTIKTENCTGVDLTKQVAMISGWATPRQADGEKNVRTQQGALNEANRKGACNDLGTTAALSTVPTERLEGYRLNPAFSLFLMGFPLSWAMIGFKAVLLQKAKYENFRSALLKSLKE